MHPKRVVPGVGRNFAAILIDYMPRSNTIAAPSRVALFTAFAAVYLIWGSTYLVMKFAVASMPPLLVRCSQIALGRMVLPEAGKSNC